MLLLSALYIVQTKKSYGGIQLVLPFKNEDPCILINYVESRKFTLVELTGNEISDKSKLKFARLKLREIYNSPTSTEGVHFVFSEKSQYWTFIEVLDILKTEKTEIFGLYGNEIWSGNDNIQKLKFK